MGNESSSCMGSKKPRPQQQRNQQYQIAMSQHNPSNSNRQQQYMAQQQQQQQYNAVPQHEGNSLINNQRQQQPQPNALGQLQMPMQSSFRPGLNQPLPIKPQAGVQVMQNDMILRKTTVKISQYAGKYKLELEFDALRPVTVAVYFFVKQKQQFFTNIHEAFTEKKGEFSAQYRESAHNQKFAAEFPQNLTSYPNEQLENNADYWPIILVLSKKDEIETKQIYYYFSIDKHGNEFSPHLKKQILELNNESYEIQEIYGVENTDLVLQGQQPPAAAEQKHANMDDCNKECIICMTDLIDTVIMPCRHMCICLECAKSFQQKKSSRLCPVCRKEIESFLRISKQQQPLPQQQVQLGNPQPNQ